MNNLTSEQKTQILDFFGKIVIEHVRDMTLSLAMDKAKGTTKNPIKLEQYKVLSTLSDEQKEAICDLLSETIKATIFNFLDMFEENVDKMKLIVVKDGSEYDLNNISEKMGGEIAFMNKDGWIQKFSKIGRFVV